MLSRALQLATYYLMVPTRRQAISAMTAHHSFCRDPPVMLRMGQLAGVKRWFRRAYATIVSMPLSALSTEECKTIGAELLYYLIQSRKYIDMVHHLQVIGGPSYRQSSACTGRTCQQGWRAFWGRFISPMLLGDHKISGALLRQQLRRIPVGICGACYRHNINTLCDSGQLDLTDNLADHEASNACSIVLGQKRGAGLGEDETEDSDDSDEGGSAHGVPADSDTEDGEVHTSDE